MAINNFLDNIVHPDAQQYAEEHSSPLDENLQQLERWVHLKMPNPHLLSGNYQGKLLEFISILQKPKHILEIGTFLGHSTVCLGKGLAADGKIHCIEANEEYEDIIAETLQKAGIADKTTVHIGLAAEILPQLGNE
ncbi:MAG: class I SAM-dependent methyltransferase, partial [Bacteroidales bacterium]|nr:class I SAM-dependent methyltransferase [Bacteroidales bacterium]